MDLPTITMDPGEASKAFLEYRASVRERHDAEEAQIMRGYKALAEGESVIDLVATIRQGGGRVQSGGCRPSRPGTARLGVHSGTTTSSSRPSGSRSHRRTRLSSGTSAETCTSSSPPGI
jgi:hypothetical protein